MKGDVGCGAEGEVGIKAKAESSREVASPATSFHPPVNFRATPNIPLLIL